MSEARGMTGSLPVALPGQRRSCWRARNICSPLLLSLLCGASFTGATVKPANLRQEVIQ